MSTYLVFINIIGLTLCLFDKILAILHRYRISEKILLGICFLGGVFGFFFASHLFHHKTHDKKFLMVMYPILVFWLIIGLWYLISGGNVW